MQKSQNILIMTTSHVSYSCLKLLLPVGISNVLFMSEEPSLKKKSLVTIRSLQSSESVQMWPSKNGNGCSVLWGSVPGYCQLAKHHFFFSLVILNCVPEVNMFQQCDIVFLLVLRLRSQEDPGPCYFNRKINTFHLVLLMHCWIGWYKTLIYSKTLYLNLTHLTKICLHISYSLFFWALV